MSLIQCFVCFVELSHVVKVYVALKMVHPVEMGKYTKLEGRNNICSGKITWL
jgi:hypothetical protein